MPSSAEILPLDAFKAQMTFFRMLALGKKSRDRRGGQLPGAGGGRAWSSDGGHFPLWPPAARPRGRGPESAKRGHALPGPAPTTPEHSTRRKAGPAGAQGLQKARLRQHRFHISLGN